MKLQSMMMLFTVMAISTASSQNIYVKFKNGSTETHPLSEVRKISFSGATMNLLKKDGKLFSWDIVTIANYRYDVSTNINEAVLRNADFTIFPNPFRSTVNIRYKLPAADKVAIEIFDMQGRSIQKWPVVRQKAGVHQLTWQANDLRGMQVPSGTYVCKIATSKGTISKMLVLE